MYNGIGLTTARGSGTNGYVQRNLSTIHSIKDKVSLRTEADILKADRDSHKGPNIEILQHARKRALEVKCAEMEDIMLEEGYSKEETEKKVAQYRAMLMEREQSNKPPINHFGQSNVRETHAVAELQQQKNARLKEAFGISEYFVEGSSLDPDRKAKEEIAKLNSSKQKDPQEIKKKRKYEWVRTPSRSPSPSERSRSRSRSSSPARRSSSSTSKQDKKDKKKKKKHNRERSSSRDSKKRKKSKKKKRTR